MARPRIVSLRLTRFLAGLLASVCLCVASASAYVESHARGRVFAVKSAPQAPVALVFGAGLAAPGEPSPVLAERLATAVALFREGKVQRLLLSGKSSRYHDEIRAMRRYVLANGVPESAVMGDGQGFTTHDSCVRAHDAFGVDRAILVTQRFHLARALFIAHAVGIDASGVAADSARERPTPSPLRELLARPWAVARVWLRR